MCPDAELLSAWVDSEVPSPWNERIASHVAVCPACGGRVASWRGLSERLRVSKGLNEEVLVARIGARIDAELAERKLAPAISLSKQPNPKRRFIVSFPIAAAAALALLLVGGLSGRFLSGTSGLASAQASGSTSGLASAPTGAGSSANLDSLVRYLEARNAPLNITIQLPSVSSAQSTGEPLIVKTPPIEMVAWPPTGSAAPTLGMGSQGN